MKGFSIQMQLKIKFETYLNKQLFSFSHFQLFFPGTNLTFPSILFSFRLLALFWLTGLDHTAFREYESFMTYNFLHNIFNCLQQITTNKITVENVKIFRPFQILLYTLHTYQRKINQSCVMLQFYSHIFHTPAKTLAEQ